MKSRLEELLCKASVAQPPDTLSRSSWLPYLPIVRVLMDERAHSLTAAVEWLVAQGEIAKKDQGMAYRSLRQILARREAKKLRLQARQQNGPPARSRPAPGPQAVAAAPPASTNSAATAAIPATATAAAKP